MKLNITEFILVCCFLFVGAAVLAPNMVESHAAGTEAAAATALKSGILPAEVQFQAGGYLPDRRKDGLGDYATQTGLGAGRSFPMLSGAITTAGGETLNLLAPTYQAATPVINQYRFNDPVSLPAEQCQAWAVIVQPADENSGRRWFAINQEGNIYASHPFVAAYRADVAATYVFGPDLRSAPSTTRAVPYRR